MVRRFRGGTDTMGGIVHDRKILLAGKSSGERGALAPESDEAGGALASGSTATGTQREAQAGMSLYGFAAKRTLDVAGALILLTLTFPVALIVAASVSLDSRGPVLFRQKRVGVRAVRSKGRLVWQQRTFEVYKFRTMFDGADQTLHEQGIEAYARGDRLPGGNPESPYKLGHDPRITRVGRFLRRTSLDELPQLLNVLRGEMSLVGPRPVPEYEVAHYSSWHRERLQVLPGITGLWQVEGRGRVPFDEAIRLDISYVRNWSLWLDLKLLLRTLPAVVRTRGAR